MLRNFATVICQSTKCLARKNIAPIIAATPKRFYGHDFEPYESFHARMEKGLADPKIDGWLVRKYLGEIQGYDHYPDSVLVIAGLKACRKVNDIALAIRFLEATELKCRPDKDVWPYLIQEITPTLKELGVPLPSELGYDKPELALKKCL